ncbi:MAG: tRNA (adenosine(37)-N6)-dimethylallyltransferase MiaA [Prevotellaceae bacterium]|jgi:tRNA dimethylallyltransferase|nr:tRNA (adenosine(37)-N6)-dimethylallyltransferase MiaA [Prevotellaceae bacterium]
MNYNIITILGPTASGKTSVATALAAKIGGEIISADSRQIYRKMDIGTGKDISEYIVDNQKVPYHLIDIAEAGYKYNLYEYQRDFLFALAKIEQNGNVPILCGGTGLYIEAALKGYRMTETPVNEVLRKTLENKTLIELREILSKYKKLHNTTDTETEKRAIRAIEIADYYTHNPIENEKPYPKLNPLIIGLKIDREKRREKITNRLKLRLENGMLNEVKKLLESGIAAEDLIYYGLEYKFLTHYITGRSSYDEMFAQLEIAIHQFAKRQMTWFRGMEKRGFTIHWLDATLPKNEIVVRILEKTNL